MNTEVECLNEMRYYEGGFSSRVPFTFDSELDYFRVNLLGRNLTFVLKRVDEYFYGNLHVHLSTMRPPYNTKLFEAVCLDDLGYKIDFEYGTLPFYYSNNKELGRYVNASAIVKFNITDKKGIIYNFDKLVLSDYDYITDFYHQFQNSINNNRFVQTKRFETRADKWKLSSITLPNLDSITYRYDSNKYSYLRSVPRRHDGEYLNKPYNLKPAKPPYGFEYLESQIEDYSIREIEYNGQKIKFSYSNERPDLLDEIGKNLIGISVLDVNNNTIRSFEFNKQFYFYDDEGHYDYKMFLTGVNDSQKEFSYNFEYYNADLLRRRTDLRFHDLFGYPNGYLGPSTYPCFPKLYISLNDLFGNKISYHKPSHNNYFEINGTDRTPDSDAVKYGTMNKVLFNTGGSLIIDYENNTYFDERLLSKKTLGPGVRVKALKYNDANNVLKNKKTYKYHIFNSEDRSSGRLLYKPSYAYFKNYCFDNEYDKENWEDAPELNVYEFEDRFSYNDRMVFDNFYTKETLEQTTNLSEELIAKKMIHISNNPLGPTSDIYGRELIYTNVTEIETNSDETKNNGKKCFTYKYVDNRGNVHGTSGFRADDIYNYPLGEYLSPYINSHDFVPYYKELRTIKGFIEKEAKEIYPFPERSFFDTKENASFGKIEKVAFFNANDELLLSKEYSYDYLKKPSINNNKLTNIKRDYHKLHQYLESSADRTFYRGIRPAGNYSQGNFQNWNGMLLFAPNKLTFNSKLVVNNILTKTYTKNGIIENNQELIYDSLNGNIIEEKNYQSDGEIVRIEYEYPDKNSNEPWIVKLFEKNLIDIPFIVKYYENDIFLKSNKDVFAFDNKDIPLLKKSIGIYATKEGETEEKEELVFYKHNSKGKPVEVSKADGTHVIYLWGYNKQYLIAKIENETFTNLEARIGNNIDVFPNAQMASNEDNDRTIDLLVNGVRTYIGTEGALRNKLETLRIVFPQAKVTTYTYDPLIGITSITDPRGQTIYYHYDEFNRLQVVKDAEGNVLSKNEYHYKN